MPPLTDSGACHQGGSATLIDQLCTSLDDRTHSELLVALVGRVLWPVALATLIVIAGRMVRGAAVRGLDRSGADVQVRTLVHNALLFGTWIVALGAGFVAAGVELTIFLTVGGASSIVLGLALQDLLRNVLAGTFLLVERPFRIGDVVTIADLTGSVVGIELRTTQLRLGDGRLAVMPNLDAFTKAVVNLSAYEQRQFTVSVWVPPDVDLERTLAAARAEMLAHPGVSASPEPVVHPVATIDVGVTLDCKYWVRHRADDPDEVTAALVRRLVAAVEAIRDGREPEPPPSRPEPATAAEPSDDDDEGGLLSRLPLPARRRRRARPDDAQG